MPDKTNGPTRTAQAVLCGHCKFYSPAANHSEQMCSRWTYGYGYVEERKKEDYIIVENDEGWGADMGPMFGCVLGELK